MLTIKHIAVLAMTMAGVSCSGGNHGGATATQNADEAGAVSVTVPQLDADSAYAYVEAQTLMGPRTPGSAGHARLQNWLVDKLTSFGADTVMQQRATVSGPDGKPLAINNIMARYNTSAPRRVLLLAHYDTRPWADSDSEAANHSKPIDGANDGGSGTALLVEIARQLQANAPAVGVDLLFVDAEDSGTSDDSDALSDLTWCLGSQYWVKHMPYPAGHLPEGAILLDMVGGRNAVFPYEYFSSTHAPALQEKIWKAAEDAGYGSRFSRTVGGAVNDDHVHLLGAGIPTVDIIETGHPETGSFNPTWHTMADNLDNIDTSTLKAVGQTVLQVIYNW